MTDSTTPNARDVLAVRSRVSWGAITAGAMVALAIYVVLTLLGLAVGIEVAVRGSEVSMGAPAAIYTLLTLLVAMFFGGWATSRLAVGESKLEAVLYGIILWGVLFVGMVWLVSAGHQRRVRGHAGTGLGGVQHDRGGARRRPDRHGPGAGRGRRGDGQQGPGLLPPPPGRPGLAGQRPAVPTDLQPGRAVHPQATWWSLAGVLLSMATVIVGALTGSGELLQQVPILGVRRPARPGPREGRRWGPPTARTGRRRDPPSPGRSRPPT